MGVASADAMTLTDHLDRLAAFEPAPYPVISLYLNTEPGQTGRDQFQTFVRKEFAGRSRTHSPGSRERDLLERDFAAISEYPETELQPSTNGVALFACSGRDLFEAVQLGVPFVEHWMSIDDRPHLYPLTRVESEYTRYAAGLADTNFARILVIATGAVVDAREVTGVKTRRTDQGGWSQARFQRHIENFHLHHAKEVVEALAEKVVDHLRLDTHASVNDIVQASLEAMKRVNERTDKEKVQALTKGQADELLLTASLREIRGSTQSEASGIDTANDVGPDEAALPLALSGEAAKADPQVVRVADELVTRARNTSARITFIEDTTLLAAYGGVAALLRFRA
jgi:peptide subunit release factor 1 (eRF1)